MRKLLILSCAVALVMSACQKEPSLENPNSTPGGSTEGTLLVRLGARIEDDSMTIDYAYNGLNRLTALNVSGIYGGDSKEIGVQLNRSAANIISSAVLKSPFFIPSGFETDSIVVKYQYDQSASRYLSAVTHVLVDDEAQADSTVFDYDGAGRLLSMTIFFDDGTGYVPDLKIDHEYAGNNVATKTYYHFDNGDLVLAGTERFEYDSKVNPLQFADEAPALSMLSFYGMPIAAMETFYSANNGTRQTIDDVDIQEPYIVTATYTYNTANRPTVANGTDGASLSTLNYYYQ